MAVLGDLNLDSLSLPAYLCNAKLLRFAILSNRAFTNRSKALGELSRYHTLLLRSGTSVP
jgi:hypothetical protein